MALAFSTIQAAQQQQQQAAALQNLTDAQIKSLELEIEGTIVTTVGSQHVSAPSRLKLVSSCRTLSLRV